MFTLMKFLLCIVPVLISVAFLTLLERKILSLVGLRVGPNKVSMGGILQPFSDAVKLMNKNLNFLSNFSMFFYYVSSLIMFFCSLICFSFFFCFPSPSSFKFSILIFFLVLGLNSLNSIVCGWSTFSKFSLIGSIRTVSQLISYEGVLYFCIFFLVILFSSFDLGSFYYSGSIFLSLFLLPCFLIWVPSFLAELNRTPFDFSEGESELVSGFNTEFGSCSFTLIFLAEYSNIFFFCLLGSYFFFNNLIFLFLLFSCFLVIWFRSVLPRFRFDKLMMVSWKFFIPFISLIYLFYLFFFLL